MLEVVTWFALALAFLCVVLAAVSQFIRPPAQAPRADPARERTALLMAAIVLVAIAAATAVVDEKVDDGAGAKTTTAPAVEQGEETDSGHAPAADDSDYFADRMASYRGHASLRTAPLRRKLCLVRYYARAAGGDPGANWWTTCRYDERLDTVEEVRERLALPRAWGPRDARVVAEIPADERVTFLLGRAAPQCEDTGGKCYDGGGVQLLFRPDDFERSWFVRHECADGGERRRRAFRACTA